MSPVPPADPSPDASGDGCPAGAGGSERMRRVFLDGNRLPGRWAGREQFVVFDSDFGSGLRFLLTLAAWRADPRRCARLHVVALVARPLTARQVLAAAPPELLPLATELAAQWPLLLPGLQRLRFDGGRVDLTLAIGESSVLMPRLGLGFDALYLSGPAAGATPDPAQLKAITRLARDGSTAASASIAPAVHAALVAGGFEVEAFPGDGEATAARYTPRWRARRFDPPAAYAGERRAMVIGAGLAGAHVAAELGARGWSVDVIDAGPVPGAGASALAWGLLHPQLSSDDNVLARLTRAGYFAVRRELGGGHRDIFQPVGVLQIADSDAEYEQWAQARRPFELPAGFAELLERAAATRVAGLVPRRGGWWFPGGGLVAAGRWCRQRVELSRARVRTAATVARLERVEGLWLAYDAAGAVLAAAPVAVVANAWLAPRLLGLAHAPVRPVRGRISLLGENDLAGLSCGTTGDGYAVRGGDGWVGVGASYELPAPGQDWPAEVDADTVHAGNLNRLERLFDPVPTVITTGFYDGIRAVSRDRLPLAGAIANEAEALVRPELRGARLPEVPRLDGLYGLFGLGSRGLSLGLLAAEIVVAQIEGEPLPVEAELAAALDPARFLLGHLRRA